MLQRILDRARQAPATAFLVLLGMVLIAVQISALVTVVEGQVQRAQLRDGLQHSRVARLPGHCVQDLLARQRDAARVCDVTVASRR